MNGGLALSRRASMRSTRVSLALQVAACTQTCTCTADPAEFRSGIARGCTYSSFYPSSSLLICRCCTAPVPDLCRRVDIVLTEPSTHRLGSGAPTPHELWGGTRPVISEVLHCLSTVHLPANLCVHGLCESRAVARLVLVLEPKLGRAAGSKPTG